MRLHRWALIQHDECPSKRTDTKKHAHREGPVGTQGGLLSSNQNQVSGKKTSLLVLNSQAPEQQENTFLLFKRPSPL